MDLDECIEKRRSVRKFKDKEVHPDDVVDMIDAARKAPSAGNLQSWKFIVVKNQDKKNKIADCCFQQNWVSEAPIIIIVIANIDEIKQEYGTRGEVLYSIQNCALAAQNLMLKATDLGLSTTYISAFEEGMLKREFKIPDNMRANAIIPVGYADENPRTKHLHSIDTMTYFESYGDTVEDWDEAFYEWSGLMKKHSDKIISKIKKGSKSLKEKISEKFMKE